MPSINSALRSTGTKLGYAVALVAAFLGSMVLSYGVVRYLSRQEEAGAAAFRGEVRDAGELRRFSNDLLELTAEYVRQVPRAKPGRLVRGTDWIQSDFLPRANELRRHMIASTTTSGLLTTLLRASDEVVLMAKSPDDNALRDRTLVAVRAASEAVEAHIAAIGADPGLSEPARLPGF